MKTRPKLAILGYVIIGGSALLVPAEERQGLPTFVILLIFREIDNVLWGRWGDLDVRVFDYAYQESEDEWRRFSGAMAAVPEGWPGLVIEPGHLSTSAHLLGLGTIEFESERSTGPSRSAARTGGSRTRSSTLG